MGKLHLTAKPASEGSRRVAQWIMTLPGGVAQAAEALERADILDWQAVLSQFNREDFLRDGYCALHRVFTADATRRLLESCKRVQALNDEWLDHDWHEPTQWEHLGLQPPSAQPTSQPPKVKNT